MIDKLDPLECARGYRLVDSKRTAVIARRASQERAAQWVVTLRITKKNLGSMILRADSGPAIGTGHVARCLTLGEAWIERGGSVMLVGTGFSRSMRKRAANAGIHVVRSARGAPFARRLRDTIREASWVVLDGYHFPSRARDELRRASSRLLLVEDRAQVGTPAADMVLDSNLGAQRADYPMQPPHARFLLGPRYALIRKEFLRASAQRVRATNGRRLLVTMGGAPRPRAIRFALTVAKALAEIDYVTLVVGTSRPPGPLPTVRARLRVLKNVQNMAQLMATHDLVLAAPGTTSWELCHMGLPSVMVAVADNQLQIGSALRDAKACEYLGPLESVEPLDAARVLDALAVDSRKKERMRKAGQRLVDGKGASRVVEALTEVLP